MFHYLPPIAPCKHWLGASQKIATRIAEKFYPPQTLKYCNKIESNSDFTHSESEEITMKTLLTRCTLICIGLIGVSLMLTNISSAEIDPKSAIAIFLFDDRTAKDTVIDHSGKRNHGTIRGKVEYDEGVFGNAIEFPVPGDIGSCLDFEEPLFNNLEEFTIVLWVNRNPDVTFADQEAFIGQHDVIMFYTPQITLPSNHLHAPQRPQKSPWRLRAKKC